MNVTYDYWLVALSVVVATLASFTALDLARRVNSTRGLAGWMWLLGGAMAMGTGIWSMHFIGMLAFRLPIAVSYHVPTTLASWLVAVIVSGFALAAVSRGRMQGSSLALGAILMGLGISLMHYTGMAALEVLPVIVYDATIFAASVAVAIAVSAVALVITFKLRRDDGPGDFGLRLLAATVMGLAICAMHYTGMAAASFSPFTVCTGASILDDTWLAVSVAAATIGLLTLVLLLSLMDARVRGEQLARRLSAARAELEQRATRDALTGLPNRLLLETSLDCAVAESRRAREPFAVMFLDVDHFKRVNDSFGHAAGDALVVEIAERLKACVRESDTVARLGGDEFVVLVRGLKQVKHAGRVARKILDTLERPVACGDVELRVSASIGVAVYPEHGEDGATLLSNADAAMYQAKHAGRAMTSFFTSELTRSARERIQMEAALGRAIDAGELELHYQPTIDVATGAVRGMEALVRWRRPDGTLVPPAEFVPVAEESRLITRLGAWVLEEACRQNRRWQTLGLPCLRVAVNISPTQFRDEAFYDQVVESLRKSGLEGRYLELEITESTVMPDPETASRILERISALGVQIAIDDFGTGHSSLGSLRRMRLDRLKIDQSFIRDLTSDGDDAAIVQAIISLGHILRMKVVAEGVENAAQLRQLQLFGCDHFQGHLCSRALPPEQFERYLASMPAAARSLPAVVPQAAAA